MWIIYKLNKSHIFYYTIYIYICIYINLVIYDGQEKDNGLVLCTMFEVWKVCCKGDLKAVDGSVCDWFDYFFSSALIILPVSSISMSPTSGLFLQKKYEKTFRKRRLCLLRVMQLQTMKDFWPSKQVVQHHTGHHGLPHHTGGLPVLALPTIIPGQGFQLIWWALITLTYPL